MKTATNLKIRAMESCSGSRMWLVVKLGKHCQLYAQVFADGQVHWRIERSKGSPLPLKQARKICKERQGLWLESVVKE
jgi:hypothetical protein